jgi:integrase
MIAANMARFTPPGEPSWRVKAVRLRRRHQDPSLRVKRGMYRIQYRDTDGRNRTKTFGRVGDVTMAEAKRAKAEFVDRLNRDIAKGLKTGRTLGDMVEKWKASEMLTIERPATRNSFLWTFGKIGAMRDASLAVLTKPDIQEWILGLGLSPASLRSVRANMSSLFESGRDWGWVDSNPVAGRFKLPRMVRREKFVLKPEHVRSLIASLCLEAKTAFLLAVLTGLRRGELMALEWADVKPPWLHVSKTVNCESKIGPPKSEKSNRTVELGQLAIDLLAAWRRESPGKLVFPPRGSASFRSLKGLMESEIAPAAAFLGLPKITWHTLRHTYNTWGHFAGVDGTIMRDLMGHSSVVVNQDVYNHARQLRPTGAAAKIEELLQSRSAVPDEVIN